MLLPFALLWPATKRRVRRGIDAEIDVQGNPSSNVGNSHTLTCLMPGSTPHMEEGKKVCNKGINALTSPCLCSPPDHVPVHIYPGTYRPCEPVASHGCLKGMAVHDAGNRQCGLGVM
ncbi:uncharacterized protein LOC131998191 isoform X1 [Stomoxys calcitrans]|uniref:uncharacterized protein LOC131994957 n=1 Tax=Stomoxys calcitrans TaxID=35570 RepID=UPI0027E3288B|nr:uncharacterized protein LOC131994957 [Stomoxys calcitrans]XP_059218438.1 uncharacterized protein LOC131995000 isoform X1 [Stomoxys calcitrans]XP_059220265.1 uncharacterized protein LOC131995544 isoform X1 [Stomoxys calcitrans]XP_059224385.1 uncharacterized protein LOC131997567 [Stomoxys calcitrans]XP_059224873.1 uncharacterized protein LOC131997672 isoform X1 [Stomoxys calcitrans]XP_059226608.1 uncharacterized protein LOC131998191 isoform X1 [Stomoxys calcitrans]